MVVSSKTIWVIMSKDRKLIAKGTPRNRELVLVSDVKDKKRFLTYSSKGMAESGFNNNWFRTWTLPEPFKNYKKEDMEAVELIQTMVTID